jgi:hypothetical protein
VAAASASVWRGGRSAAIAALNADASTRAASPCRARSTTSSRFGSAARRCSSTLMAGGTIGSSRPWMKRIGAFTRASFAAASKRPARSQSSG